MRRLAAITLLSATLATPAAALADTQHTVRAGEMLGSIAEDYGVSVADIRRWNGLSGDFIREGQHLTIRSTTTSTASARTSAPRASSTVSPARSSATGSSTYVVRSGDTLGGIAARVGASIEDLVSWNRGLDPDRIRVGQELSVRSGGRVTRRVEYIVARGDTAGAIAERHGVSVADLRSWNTSLNPDRIREGQRLTIVVRGPEVPSESIGRAAGGRLVHPEQLPSHRAYTIRDEDRAWATNETVVAMMDAFDYMSRRFDTLPRIEIHDLSAHDGGPISDHASHQSGRDVDIGYYQRGCRRDCRYQTFAPQEMDFERQWALLSYWIERDMVEYVFMDYSYQEALVGWLRERGESRAHLQAWFQYPRGRGTPGGIIRHEPNHADHIHVRFRCPPSDDRCV